VLDVYRPAQAVHFERMPAREARFSDLREPMSNAVRWALQVHGIDRLYLHQAQVGGQGATAA
jgi:hypothetical protein